MKQTDSYLIHNLCPLPTFKDRYKCPRKRLKMFIRQSNNDMYQKEWRSEGNENLPFSKVSTMFAYQHLPFSNIVCICFSALEIKHLLFDTATYNIYLLTLQHTTFFISKQHEIIGHLYLQNTMPKITNLHAYAHAQMSTARRVKI